MDGRDRPHRPPQPPHWNMPLCRLAAWYAGRVPREAFAFAAEMELEWERKGGEDWEAWLPGSPEATASTATG